MAYTDHNFLNADGVGYLWNKALNTFKLRGERSSYTLLWENPTPSSATQASQTITLAKTPSKKYIVIAYSLTSGATSLRTIQEEIFETSSETTSNREYSICCSWYGGSTFYTAQRYVTFTTGTTATISTAYYISRTSSSWIGPSSNNGNIIIRYIYETDYHDDSVPTTSDWNGYPVGAIYMSTSSVSPASLFGGTWEQISGRFLVGQIPQNADSQDMDDIGYSSSNNRFFIPNQNGGAANYMDIIGPSTYGITRHQLTEQEMPSHNHGGYLFDQRMGVDAYRIARNSNAANGSGNSGLSVNPGWLNMGIIDDGSGYRHNNMPPFYIVYMWRRTA